MENKEKIILKKVLIDTSFDEAGSDWYKCGSNYVNFTKLLDIINQYNNFDEKRLKKEIKICEIESEILKLKKKLEVLKNGK